MMINSINNVNFKSRAINSKELAQLKKSVAKREVFLYDVDLTNGFMDQQIITRKDGLRDGFPVMGADKIIPTLLKLRDYAKGLLPKFETVDAHKMSDPEMQVFKAISDIHCEKGTKGFEKIPESIFGEPNALIEVEQYKADVPLVTTIKRIFSQNGIIRMEKNETSPLKYGNGETGLVEENKKAVNFFENLKQAGANIALVYGVATDFCVKDAVAACKRFGIKPFVIKDAVKEAVNNSVEDINDPVYGDVALISTEQLGEVLR